MINPKLLKYLVLSLYAGWGGADAGLHKAGFFTPWAVDWDKHARENFRLNAPYTRIEGFDLFRTRIQHIIEVFGITPNLVDLCMMACPCQGISNAGKGDPYDERNTLFLRSVRHYIPAVLPKVFVIENVAALKNRNMILFYNLLQDEYEKLSGEYIIEQKILNTLHIGPVPQDRERYIAIGAHRSLGITPTFPEPDLPILWLFIDCGVYVRI